MHLLNAILLKIDVTIKSDARSDLGSEIVPAYLIQTNKIITKKNFPIISTCAESAWLNALRTLNHRAVWTTKHIWIRMRKIDEWINEHPCDYENYINDLTVCLWQR